MSEDKIKKSLQLCSEKKCNECIYNRWVKDVCQAQLCRDAIKLIDKIEQQKKVVVEQFTMNI